MRALDQAQPAPKRVQNGLNAWCNPHHVTVLKGARIVDPLLSKVPKMRINDPRSIAHAQHVILSGHP